MSWKHGMNDLFDSHSETNHNFPEEITIHEHKAPTDESIKLADEFQEKILNKLLKRIKLDDNLVKGEIWIMQSGWQISLDHHKIFINFSINGQEFHIEDEIKISEELDKDMLYVSKEVKDKAKSVMLYYVMKKLKQSLFNEITNSKLPDSYI